jgi:hypothetical protein
MSIAEIALRLVGAFYIFAGCLLVRAIGVSRLVDSALEQLGHGDEARSERLQTVWSIGLAGLVFASGLSLLLLSEVAAGLFLAASLAQALFIAWIGPRYVDRDGKPPNARRQTVNAFVLYATATAAVVWAAERGVLTPWRDTSALVLALAASGMLAFAGYVSHTLWAAMGGRETAHGEPDEPRSAPLRADPARVRSIRVLATLGEAPLFAMDADNLGYIAPADLGLSKALQDDLAAWSAAYASLLGAEAADGGATGGEPYLAHFTEGYALARRLAGERPDLAVHAQDVEGVVVRVAPA